MKSLLSFIILILMVNILNAQLWTEKVKTEKGDLSISMIGWATLKLEYNGKIIYVDPSDKGGSYDNLPKADLIFLTHTHFDHLNIGIIQQLLKKDTKLIITEEISYVIKDAIKNNKLIILPNNNNSEIDGIKFTTVPAYNMGGEKIYHEKGKNNGYIFHFVNLNLLIAGDTENIPELKSLKDISIAFLPLNRPYTMDENMFVDLVKSMKPKIVYPYHYDSNTVEKVKELLADSKETELRVKPISK